MRKELSVAEKAYKESVRQPLEQAARIGEADIVVGIPFCDEANTIGHVVEVAQEGLNTYYPDKRCVLCCVGAPDGDEALASVQLPLLPQELSRIAFLMKNPMVSGKGWALRAMMEITDRLGSDLVILEADLLSGEDGNSVRGLSPHWISLLLEPIRKEGFDLVLSGFNRHWLEAPISNHLIHPLIAAIYGLEIRDPLGGELAISSEFLRSYLDEPSVWTSDVGRYGVDVWLITKAIAKQANIAEACLGVKLHKPSPGKQEMVLREQAKVIFDQMSLSRDYWKEKKEAVQAPTMFGHRDSHRPVAVKLNLDTYVSRYRKGFNRFHALYQEILPKDTFKALEKLAESKPREFEFSSKLWSKIVYDFVLTFCLDKRFVKDDITSAFIPLYQGRVAGFAKGLGELEKELQSVDPDRRERLLSLEAEKELEEQVSEFVQEKAAFVVRWEKREREIKPLLPQVTYREFIPGVSLVLPHEFMSPTGKAVATDKIYRAILERYQKEFDEFVHERLKVPRWATSFEIAESIGGFMGRAERELGRLLQGDLHSVEGTSQVAQAIFTNFPHRDTFTLTPEVASWILRQIPPANLLIKFGKTTVTELEEEYEPNAILALSSFSEERDHTEKVWSWILDNARPEHFGRLAVKPLVVSYDDFPSLAEMKEASALSKLSGRIVICNLRKGMGGEFPKLRYFTMVAKNIAEAERFSEIWEEFALKRKEFGRKVINSLEGHWGKETLSAHNIFENKHQRVLVQRLKEMAKNFKKRREFLSLARMLEDIAGCYHLAVTLPDGKFVPCSAWTWASYSFKGGEGFPTPLSLHVERDWATREFMVELYHALGGSEEMLDEKIVELMGQGRESENLAKIILPKVAKAEEVYPERVVSLEEPRVGELHRFDGNPILESIKEHPWESKYVFNAGAIRLKNKVYIIYRAVGEDMTSRLGLAVSSDGFRIDERWETPIFEPGEEWERKGCEDPRLALLNGRIYMLYTAYSSIAAQIAMASIDVADFLSYRWQKWQRHGLLFPGLSDKDAILFPQKFDGRYAIYHRIYPSVWVSFSENLDSPWSLEDHRILIGPRTGMVWDGVKVGAGAQPIKTKYGWLLIYHGMDYADAYRLGVLIVDLNDPGKILYRSPNYILEPRESYETGEEDISQVPNVVFTCGAVPIADKDVLADDDEIIVYYGAADTVIAAATAKVSELIPRETLATLPG